MRRAQAGTRRASTDPRRRRCDDDKDRHPYPAKMHAATERGTANTTKKARNRAAKATKSDPSVVEVFGTYFAVSNSSQVSDLPILPSLGYLNSVEGDVPLTPLTGLREVSDSWYTLNDRRSRLDASIQMNFRLMPELFVDHSSVRTMTGGRNLIGEECFGQRY